MTHSASPSPETAPPRVRRFPTFFAVFRWLFSRRQGRRLGFALIVLVTLVGLLYAVENFRGARAWKAYVREQAAQSEKLTLTALAPPPVPDDQNLAACPLLNPIFDYRIERTGKYGRTKTWRDTNGLERLGRLFDREGIVLNYSRSLAASHSRDPQVRARLEAIDEARRGLDRIGRTNGWINLAAWQKFYRAGTNLADVPPGTPAADVLAALRGIEADLGELQREAARRPLARWPIRYDDEMPYAILLPHLARIKGSAQMLHLRAAARFAAGDTAGGLADLELGMRLAESLRDEPLLISQLVRIACHALLVQPLKEGLARHLFTDAQLADLQQQWGAPDLLAGYQLAMRGERAAHSAWVRVTQNRRDWLDFFDVSDTWDLGAVYWVLRYGPKGWVYQNQLRPCRLIDQFGLPVVDSQARRVYPQRAGELEQALEKERGLFSMLARLCLPATSSISLKCADGQTRLDQAAVAVALERHRLAHGQYPETLGALAPRFLSKIPQDAISGEPIKYRLSSDGRYLLYGVGWNLADDAGAETKTKSGKVHDKTGDWVWELPIAAAQGLTQPTAGPAPR
jgi:hypothetical protein